MNLSVPLLTPVPVPPIPNTLEVGKEFHRGAYELLPTLVLNCRYSEVEKPVNQQFQLNPVP
jgi:hypothetical protein